MPFRATLKHLKNSISCLCRWQKRLFSSFRVYVVDRNTYFLFFVLMSLTEAIIFFFSCLCHWQKRFFSSFCAYVVDRSAFFLHFALMSLTEAFIFFISCLCRWQKHWENSFYLTEWCCSLKFLVLFSSNRKYRFQILFLKSTDRVEVGCDDVSIGMMIEWKAHS